MSKEIIDLLEKIKNSRTVTGPTDERLSVILELKEIANQALILFKQQLTAGEWTKLWRERLENSITLYKMGKSPDEWFSSIVTGFQEACDRLDTAEAENKRVNAGWATESQLRENLLQENYQFQARLDTAEAENQKLKNQKEYIYKKEVAQLKMAESINADLLEACEGMVKDLEMIEQDEAIIACQCMAKTPDDITDPLPCYYCAAKTAIAKAKKEG